MKVHSENSESKLWSWPTNILLLGRGLIFLGVCFWLAFAPKEYTTVYAWILASFFLLHLGLFFYLSRKRKILLEKLFFFNFIFDILFITALIFFTGKAQSNFYLLYYLSVSIGSYYLGFGGGLFLTFLASLSYLCLIMLLGKEIFAGDLMVRVSFLWFFAIIFGMASKFIKVSERRLFKTLDVLNQRTVELERTQVQIETIYETSRALGEIYNLEEVLDEILRIAKDILGFQSLSVLLFDKKKECLLLKAKFELEKKFKFDPPKKIPLTGITGSVVKSRKGVRIFDVRTDPRYVLGLEDARSEMAVPMISRGKVVGVLDAESKKIGAFEEADQKVFSILASSAAMAIENAMLHQQTEELTIIDELTGIYNFRYFTKKLTGELKRAKRYHQPLSLLMIDIDWFKRCNDSYGHLFGNFVLKTLSSVISSCIREVDILSRYGGEEFVVILPQTTKIDAKRIGERIRYQVESTTFKDKTGPTKTFLTVSLGVASYPVDAEAQEELIKKVDQALYIAKGKGKNLVCTL